MQLAFDVSALIVVIALLFAIVMWCMVWRLKYPIPIWDVARIFSIAFSIQLAIYIVFSFVLIDIQLRAYMVRTSIIVICLSQGVPLLSAYNTWKHGQGIT